VTSFFNAIDLNDATLVVQDWGGPIGLSALAAVPDRFGGSAIVMRTDLPICAQPPCTERAHRTSADECRRARTYRHIGVRHADRTANL
jgi:hypothetical protein